MNTRNQEMKKMTYETHKSIEAKTNKERQEFKQSQHDYTIRSEWCPEKFDFWGWKTTQIKPINHTKRWKKEPGDEEDGKCKDEETKKW